MVNEGLRTWPNRLWLLACREVPIPTAKSYAYGITARPNGALWFTENVGNIGREAISL
jgi:hypothetical protein